MGVDDISRISPTSPPGAGPAGAGPPAGGDGVEFRRLLEQLEKLSRTGADPGRVATPSQLEDALAKADADYQAAMDLRRALEDAYRRRTE